MSLKFAVLGLLTERRSYGYQLVQRLNERLGPAWQLNPSAVYGALDQLEDGGLIRETAARQETRRRRARVVYEATDRGDLAFSRWMNNALQRQEPVRSEMQLRLALATGEHVPALMQAIERELWRVRVLRDHAVDHAYSLSAADDATWLAERAGLLRSAARIRLDAELAWLEHAQTVLMSRCAYRDVQRPHLVSGSTARKAPFAKSAQG